MQANFGAPTLLGELLREGADRLDQFTCHSLRIVAPNMHGGIQLIDQVHKASVGAEGEVTRSCSVGYLEDRCPAIKLTRPDIERVDHHLIQT